jgi:hypothetical protein
MIMRLQLSTENTDDPPPHRHSPSRGWDDEAPMAGPAAAPYHGNVKRYFTTRPTRLTVVLAVLAIALLAVSFLVPGTPAHHVRVGGHRETEYPLGWQEVVIGALRIGGVIAAIAAALRHQKTVETVDDIIRQEAATIPYDRSASVDARGNTRVASEPRRR